MRADQVSLVNGGHVPDILARHASHAHPERDMVQRDVVGRCVPRV